jgi:hypothetical protein
VDGTPVLNKRKTTCPLKVALADGRQVISTHMCDIVIPGLPTTLVGHIVLELSIASLFGIRVLAEAGCTVKFDNQKCVVKYNSKIILVGMKDPMTDLWTLPIVSPAGTHTSLESEQDPFDNLRDKFLEKAAMLAAPIYENTQASKSEGKAMTALKNPPPSDQLGLFTHTVRTKANSIRFAHQSLCSPHLSTLLKAIRRNFLKGCHPNLTAKGVTQYLRFPSMDNFAREDTYLLFFEGISTLLLDNLSLSICFVFC